MKNIDEIYDFITNELNKLNKKGLYIEVKIDKDEQYTPFYIYDANLFGSEPEYVYNGLKIEDGKLIKYHCGSCLDLFKNKIIDIVIINEDKILEYLR